MLVALIKDGFDPLTINLLIIHVSGEQVYGLSPSTPPPRCSLINNAADAALDQGGWGGGGRLIGC